MAKIEFEDLDFEDLDDKIRVTFLKIFCADIKKEEIKDIDDFKIEKNAIIFKNLSENRARKRFYMLLERSFKSLKNNITKKPTIYIHKNSGIPLIGHVAFGIVDRNSSLIEVKPITSCNLDCIYCSVDQSKRETDFVIEEEYLIEELKKLIKQKGTNSIEIHLNSQGEPLLYAPITQMVKDIASMREVSTISIDTNATLLSKQLADQLIEAGMTRFNISVNAIDPRLASKIANKPYDIEKIKEICRYVSKRADLLLAPVLVPGINEGEMPKIIRFAKEINAKIGIQSFLNYRFGKNPAKQLDWDEFKNKLKAWENQYDIKLLFDESDFSIKKAKKLEKPFDKGDIVKAKIVCSGRIKDEKLAVSKDRIISIPKCSKEGVVKLKITRSKHNIFVGELV